MYAKELYASGSQPRKLRGPQFHVCKFLRRNLKHCFGHPIYKNNIFDDVLLKNPTFLHGYCN